MRLCLGCANSECGIEDKHYIYETPNGPIEILTCRLQKEMRIIDTNLLCTVKKKEYLDRIASINQEINNKVKELKEAK